MTTRYRRAAGLLALLWLFLGFGAPALAAAPYVPVSGAGSTWSQNALDQWRRNVTQYGMQINYSGTGSSDGRNQFRNGTVDYAVSEIPYGLSDTGVVDQPPARPYAYMPIVAGGTSFMYNLKIGGKQVTNLRLSQDVLAKIFTGVITRWNDPAIKADNPALALPGRSIVPVVRSDGSGTTAQLTTWLSKRFGSVWDDYCRRAGRPTPCGITSVFPVVPGGLFTAQSGSLGVSGYVAQSSSEGAITYVEYSYALNTGFPVVKVRNAANYYTEPTAENVAVALMRARIDERTNVPTYLTQILDDVYVNPDRRTYPLSSYSYMIIPTSTQSPFSTDKGRTLGAFGYYFLCQGQQQAKALGYSPLPINLVQAGFTQVRRIPGVNVQSINIRSCNNPTFSTNGSNTLANTAPYPPACDQAGATQCTSGTGGARRTSTPASNHGSSGNGNNNNGGTGTNNNGGNGGSNNNGNSGNGTNNNGTSGPKTSSPNQPGAVDPDTGQSIAAGNGGGGDAAAIPVDLTAANGTGVQTALMIVGGTLLGGLAIVPPLLARSLDNRRRSR